ncbi:C45 family autoproteolytic acyltransferase/hydolase [Roseovarius dicentrarchi]|uniref:C45 family autoproteolytic acyltransferase/hydolase n=1 Tax=Roseovarius dicentrarchi TaxID=2250573 RepID=UPI000DE91B0E|nr:C45 family peptidase [Roseovarius dicentrarchi]
MTDLTLQFDAISEVMPGPKWAARWRRCWPDYRGWFIAKGGDDGPSLAECKDALRRYMPELVPTYARLTALAGGSDRAARFLSTWCPPAYLGGCSLAAVAQGGDVRLVRNYDLAPELNEGMLLRSEWCGRAVMGMSEFLWGLSDGVNEAGLAVAIAYGGRPETGIGFGITTIIRYLLETCDTVDEALAALRRVPSHMAYNLVLADASGATKGVEVLPGGGIRITPRAIATNHQSGPEQASNPGFTLTHARHAHLDRMQATPRTLNAQFLTKPLLQDRYAQGFGTLFTAEYDPVARSLGLTIKGTRWDQTLEAFTEGRRDVDYSEAAPMHPPAMADAAPDAGVWAWQGQQPAAQVRPAGDWAGDWAGEDWAAWAAVDWAGVGMDYAAGRGRPIHSYLPKRRTPMAAGHIAAACAAHGCAMHV